MAYTEQVWEDSPSTASPISASRLNYMEAGIGDTATGAENLVTGSGTVVPQTLWTGTDAEYTAIPTPDPATLYVVRAVGLKVGAIGVKEMSVGGVPVVNVYLGAEEIWAARRAISTGKLRGTRHAL